jgi:hypothetical protein
VAESGPVADLVVTRKTFRGPRTGHVMGLQSTGEPVRTGPIAILRIANRRRESGLLGLPWRSGAVPAPGQPGA